MKNPINIIPIATYRLQFHSHFTFQQATDLTKYLHDLGISHCYASPLFQAKPGSEHGYDVVDQSKINPDLGKEEDLETLIKSLRSFDMGLICDIVPNHMYIASSSNKWWNDVLENGPASPYADYFDIDWNSPREELVNKVLLPLLDQQYGEALENQILKVIYREGGFYLELPRASLPTDPCSWTIILEPLAQKAEKKLTEDHPDLLELKSIITSLTHLPTTTDLEKVKMEERQREKEIVKRRLANLLAHSAMMAELISNSLISLNGKKGDSRSFDLLEGFLNIQPYRLCFWRVANDEINYRRFFDIFEYAGIRTEKPEVFAAIHSLIFYFIQKQWVDGIRIDHIDGLWDPEQYLQDLQQYCKQICEIDSNAEDNKNKPSDKLLYLVVEKILIGNEKLRPEWPVSGTVGYDFLNQLNGIFVAQSNKKAIQEIYRNFTGVTGTIFELTYLCKKLILIVSMSSELYVLARHLDRISEQHRNSRDFTEESLRAALRDVIACFPVYRSYIRADIGKIHEEDRHYILTAIMRAKRLNPAISASIFDFIQKVLLLEPPSGLDEKQIAVRQNFVMRFQQLTGPVMAKGIEDTAFYRFFPLASLNEVGSDPHSFGVSLETFHKKNQERLESWPHTMTTTSTHDTKRSEDVRARINVLSEIPEEWSQALARWSELNRPHKTQDGDEFIPDANEEYLLYQTLIGTWPLYPMDPAAHLQYLNRIQAYMKKATNEAKINTSWINPNDQYDQAVKLFVEKVLNLDSNSNVFLNEFKIFVSKISLAGMLNSLSQVLIKITSPGIPDIYQGNEIWDFSLVDPDNRGIVDFQNRKYLLQNLLDKEKVQSNDLFQQLLLHPEDGRIKLFITSQALRLRNKLPKVFSQGSYLPLSFYGDQQNHLIAFARVLERKAVLVIAGRFFTTLLKDTTPLIESSTWKETYLTLPSELKNLSFSNVFTGATFAPEEFQGQACLSLEKILGLTSCALLESTEG